MASAPGSLELTNEVPAATAGDTTLSPASGRLLLFPSGGVWYAKDAGGVVTPLQGVPITRTVTAGAGLTGGGALSADRTFDVVAGDGTIVVGVDQITVGTIGSANITDGSIVNADINASAAIALSKLATQAANTLNGNITGATSVPAANALAASQFLARPSAGNIAAQSITTAGLAWVAAADVAAETALLNVATTSLKGLMSTTDKTRSDNWYNNAYYNVQDWGILPSNSGATNVTNWNTLMGSVADNATVFWPPSSTAYDVASVLAIPSGKHLKQLGGGKQKTIIRTTSATANIFTVGDWYNIFEGLKFTSSVTRTGGAAILSGDNVDCSVYRCAFVGMFNALDYSGGANAGNLAIIDDCIFNETQQFSIRIDGTNANTIIRGCVGDGTAGLADAHVELNACGSLAMSDCDWIRAVNNLHLNPDSGIKGVFSVYCTNVFFDTASGSSVKFGGGAVGTNVQRVKFVNCWFSGSVIGCEFPAVTSTNKPAGVDFVACDIFSNSSIGILATEVQDFGIVNCRIAGNTTAGVRINAAASSATKFTITNNTVGTASGIAANGIGIDVVAGTYGPYNIAGNIISGNTTNLSDLGTVATTDMKQVIDNVGVLIAGAIGTLVTGVTSVAAADTLLMNARIPANAVQIGQSFRVTVGGLSSSTGTLIFRLHCGAAGTVGDATIWTGSTSAAQVATGHATVQVLATVRTIGAGGTIVAEGLQVDIGATIFARPTLTAALVTGAVATTAAWFLTLSVTSSVGTFTANVGVIEAL